MLADIDDNTFAGFDKIRKTIASNDTADIQYSQDLSLIVREVFGPFHKLADSVTYLLRVYAVAGPILLKVARSCPLMLRCC